MIIYSENFITGLKLQSFVATYTFSGTLIPPSCARSSYSTCYRWQSTVKYTTVTTGIFTTV